MCSESERQTVNEPEPPPPLFEILWEDASDCRHVRLRKVLAEKMEWSKRAGLPPMKIDADDRFSVLEVSNPYILKTPKDKVCTLFPLYRALIEIFMGVDHGSKLQCD